MQFLCKVRKLTRNLAKLREMRGITVQYIMIQAYASGFHLLVCPDQGCHLLNARRLHTVNNLIALCRGIFNIAVTLKQDSRRTIKNGVCTLPIVFPQGLKKTYVR